MRRHTGGALVLAGFVALAGCDGGNVFGSTRIPATSGNGTGTIAGQVQAGGSGLAGVTVLLGTSDSTVTTTAGAFRFTDLTVATYTVTVRVPLGYAPAAGETGVRSVTIPAGGGTVGTSFALQQTSTVGF